MSDQARYFRLGLFALLGIGLFVAAVIVLGGSELFEEGELMETYIDESVQGLDEGTPLKFRGVPIGTVKKITFVREIYPLQLGSDDYYRLGSYVLVRVKLKGDLAMAARGVSSLPRMVKEGLRVRLAAQGLTGTSYLELDYLDPVANPPLPISWEPAVAYVPSAQSQLKSFTGAAERVFSRLEQLPIEKLITEISGALVTVEKAVSGVQTEKLSAEMQSLLVDMRKTSEEVRKVAHTVNFAPVLARLDATLGQMEATFGQVDDLVGGQRAELEQILQSLGAASADLRALADEARGNPSRLLFGEPPPPFRPPERPDRSR